jgi:hypothetical protein
MLDKLARSLIGEAGRDGIVLRAIGGVAILLRCPSAAHRALAREYGDIDFCGRKNDLPRLEHFFATRGFTPLLPFNRLNAETSQRFENLDRGISVDVFLDRLKMCHTLHFHERLAIEKETLPLADLILTKLQIVQLNDKDLKDIYALVMDYSVTDGEWGSEGIDASRIASVCADDWGWYRTATGTLDQCAHAVTRYVEDEQARHIVFDRLMHLRKAIEDAPKSRKWRMRAKIGERVQWYEIPEELVRT